MNKKPSSNMMIINDEIAQKRNKKTNMIDDELSNVVVIEDAQALVYAYLTEIIYEVKIFDVYVQIMKNFHLVVSNIVNSPKEEKYKKIKAESPFLGNYIFPYTSTTNFFFFLNFKKCEIDKKLFYVFIGELRDLTKYLDFLNDFLIEKSKLN